MEELIVKLADEQEDRKKFKELCTQIYRYLTSKKIKDNKLLCFDTVQFINNK